ncbi:hypothetical protein TB1_042950 [Malus domestica]
MQYSLDEVSQSRTGDDNEPLQLRPSKQPPDQSRTEHSDSVHSRLGSQDSVYSHLSTRRSVNSRLGLRTSIYSRLAPYSDNQHEQPSRQIVHSWLGLQ